MMLHVLILVMITQRLYSVKKSKDHKVIDYEGNIFIIGYFESKITSGTEDDLDLLFSSYARTIKKFSGKLQAETKLQIAQLIAQQEIMHHEEVSSQQLQQ
nr:unnamed protein product [Callosobruchus chinensis]